MIDSKLGSSDSSDSTRQGGGESDEISSEDFSDSDNVPAALESMYDSAIEADNYNDSFGKTEMIIEEEIAVEEPEFIEFLFDEKNINDETSAEAEIVEEKCPIEAKNLEVEIATETEILEEMPVEPEEPTEEDIGDNSQTEVPVCLSELSEERDKLSLEVDHLLIQIRDMGVEFEMQQKKLEDDHQQAIKVFL